MKNSFIRRAFGTAMIAFAVALSGCGGGGGGGSTVTPPPPASPTGQITKAIGCTVPDGQTTCNPDMAWISQNTTSAFSVNAGGVSVSKLTTGELTTLSIPVGNTTFALVDGSSQLDSKTVTASCADGSSVQNGVCQKTQTDVLHYATMGLAVWDNGTLWAATETSNTTAQVQAVINATSFQTGANPVNTCGRASKKLDNGYVLAKCTAAADSQQHVFQYNPTTNKLSDFTGIVPSDITFISVEAAGVHPTCTLTHGALSTDASQTTLSYTPTGGSAQTLRSTASNVPPYTIKTMGCYSN